MHPAVPGHLRVERGGQDRALADCHDVLAGAGQHLNLRAHPLDPGGADEDRVDGAVEAGEVDVALERIDLAAECVPAHRHVDGT